MTRRRVTVSGRVQGVFFRSTAKWTAEREGVAGWAKNRPDGSVEAVFEGPEEAVERLVAFCRTGPEGAEVDRIDVSAEEPEGLQGFEVE